MTSDSVAPRAKATPDSGAALKLTAMVIVLAAVATAGGIFIPGLYRFAAWLVPAARGQDLVTLLSLPVMLAAMQAARRGSVRAQMVWIGILGYVLYSYIGAAFAYDFNPFFLIYVALFSLSIFGLAATVRRIDTAEVQKRFDAGTPRRPVAAFLALMAFMLAAMWLARVIPNLTATPAPDTIEPFKYVLALDLGLIVPLMLMAAVGLWRRGPWGHVLAGIMLIKSATMGLALLAMTWFTLRAGQPTDPAELIGMYTVIAVGGLGMTVWFFRHCRG